MKRLLFVYNPRAGGGKLLDSLTYIKNELDTLNIPLHMLKIKQSGDARRWAEGANVDDWVVVLGGDGTVHEVINGLSVHTTPPLLSIIPGGTANDFARTLNIPLDWKAASQFPPPQAVDRIIRKVDVIKRGASDYFANFWGIGYVTQVSEAMESEEKRWLGKLAYYIETVQQLDRIPTFSVRLEWPDGIYDGPAQLVLVLNGNCLGGVRLLSDDVSVTDGLVDVLVIKRLAVAQIGAFLAARWTEEAPEHEAILYFKTKKVTITAQPSQSIDCDGEDGGHTPADLSVIPSHLRILLPMGSVPH